MTYVFDGNDGITFPGKRGDDGPRGCVMFIDGSINTDRYIDFVADSGQYRIKNIYPNLTPDKNDYILFNNCIYEIMSYDKTQGYYITKLISSMKSSGKNDDDSFDIIVGTKSVKYNSIPDSYYIDQNVYDVLTSKMDDVNFITFNIVSSSFFDDKTKITLELYTDNTSANMFSMRPTLYNEKSADGNGVYTQHVFTGDPNFVPPLGDSSYGNGSIKSCHFDNSKYNGSIFKYNYLTTKFDNEKMDNFEIIIKDWNDGVGEKTVSYTSLLPKDALDPITFYCNYYEFKAEPSWFKTDDGFDGIHSDKHPYIATAYKYSLKENGRVTKEKIGQIELTSDLLDITYGGIVPRQVQYNNIRIDGKTTKADQVYIPSDILDN